MAYCEEIRLAAMRLYLKRWTPKEIKDELGLASPRVVYYWAEKYNWADLLSEESIEDGIARRIQLLTTRENKNRDELDELDRLIGHHVKLIAQRAKTERQQQRQPESGDRYDADSKPDTRAERGGDKPRRRGGKPPKNDVSELTAESFQAWLDTLFGYQLRCRDAKNDPEIPRTRNILKSRQIGMTYYFAGEALEDAILTGGNQIFLSATRGQAEVFRSYIIKIAQEFLGVTLTGNPITLSNGANLYFLATSSQSAQSRSGNVYIDEYFWIRDFTKLNNVAAAMATQTKWRKTYFSTPSAKNHSAYPFWTGDTWRGEKKARQHAEFPGFDELRDGGRICPDRQWRYVITVEDAVELGLNLVDLDELRDENSEAAWLNLYMCQFVDDAASVFKFHDLEQCYTDAAHWTDFQPRNRRPFGEREVWLGYDPSRTRDNATLVVLAPPMTVGERFRVLERVQWRGLNFRYQASEIIKIAERYRVTYIGIDITGIGYGVYDELKDHFGSKCRAIHYSVESKNELVLKMIDLVEGQRIQWDAGSKDIPAAFMAIKRGTTGSGNAMTFRAGRDATTGHADVFFAIAHAAANEPLNTNRKTKSRWVAAA